MTFPAAAHRVPDSATAPTGPTASTGLTPTPPYTPAASVLAELQARCEAYARRDSAVWIHRLTTAELHTAVARSAAVPEAAAALRGLTFAIKDNIDLADVPTTAACPAYAYTPGASAPVVERLLAAGAIPVGKTNLDQFATGLVGVRSPYGTPRNVFNPDFISGGSSSGSAVAVAAGLVDFSLGTDTAGSGRVPAALNGLVGLKPTRGRLSTRGVVPACRSLDCVSIFARSVGTAARVLAVAEGYDAEDPFSRRMPATALSTPPASDRTPAAAATTATPPPAVRRIGVPRAGQLNWLGDAESPTLFADALQHLLELGIVLVPIDFTPFLAAARLLYEGPWTAERYAAVGEFIEKHSATPEAARAAGLDPTVTKIILSGRTPTAADAFRASYRLAELRRAADEVWTESGVDALVAPTVGTVYTLAQVLADPVHLNSNLGLTNNFLNLLDLCGLTLPTGRYQRGPGFGVTLIGPAWTDARLLALGARYLGEAEPVACDNQRTTTTQPAAAQPAAEQSTTAQPASSQHSVTQPEAAPQVLLAVCGAHLRGQPLHGQLDALAAQFVAATTTRACYRLYALADTVPPKPGLVHAGAGDARREIGGAAIAVEVYALTPEAFGRFVATVPPPLVIGNVELADGTAVKGFLCEPRALHGASDITAHGGWAAYRAAGAS